MAAAQLPPRLQTSTADRNVWVATRQPTAHHMRDMRPSRQQAAAQTKARAVLRRAAESPEREPRRTAAAHGLHTDMTAQSRGHGYPPLLRSHSPTAREDALVAAARDSSQALEHLAGQLAHTLSSGDVALLGEATEESQEADSLSELVRTLRLHAVRTREALERERDRRHRDVARLTAQLSVAQDEHARLRDELDSRVEAAVAEERERAQQGVASNIERAVQAADARAAQEIERLQDQHLRVVEGLRRRLARYELPVAGASGAPAACNSE